MSKDDTFTFKFRLNQIEFLEMCVEKYYYYYSSEESLRIELLEGLSKARDLMITKQLDVQRVIPGIEDSLNKRKSILRYLNDHGIIDWNDWKGAVDEYKIIFTALKNEGLIWESEPGKWKVSNFGLKEIGG